MKGYIFSTRWIPTHVYQASMFHDRVGSLLSTWFSPSCFVGFKVDNWRAFFLFFFFLFGLSIYIDSSIYFDKVFLYLYSSLYKFSLRVLFYPITSYSAIVYFFYLYIFHMYCMGYWLVLNL